MRIFVFIILTLNLSLAFSQGFKEEYAIKLTNQLEYIDAYPIWAELSNDFIKKKKGSWNYLRKASETAFYSEQFEISFYWDSLLIVNKQANIFDWYQILDLLCINNQHSLLQSYVDSALQIYPKDSLLILWKEKSETIINLLKSKTDFDVIELRPNAKGEEFASVPYKKGLIFISSEHAYGFLNTAYGRTGQNYTNIAFIPDAKNPTQNFGLLDRLKNKDLWNEILQTKTHDGPVSFSKDFKQAFVTSNQTKTDTANGIKYSNLQLKLYSRQKSGWQEDKTFAWNDPKFSTGHAVLDNEKNLIFASNKPGGFGGCDLYKSIWKIDHWSEPINLGPLINTSRDELFPFVSVKGELYFASNGWTGIGGLDIFKSDFSENIPKHIGIPINSSADDFAFNFNDATNKGYLSSNRNNRKDQLFLVQKIVEGVELKVNTITCNENAVGNITLKITDKTKNISHYSSTDNSGSVILILQKSHMYSIVFNGNETSLADSILFTARSNGQYEKNLKIKFKNQVTTFQVVNENKIPIEGAMLNLYKKKGDIKQVLTPTNGLYSWINAGAELKDSVFAYFINHNDVGIRIPKAAKDKCNDSLFIPLIFSKKQADEYINLDLILYDFDEFFLRPEGKIELEKLVKYMKARPTLIVELSSHTDSRGEFDYNIILSNNRSQSCIDYIISKGIKATNILAKGYGESKLVNNCADNLECSEEEHQQNRRTELKLLIPK